MIIPLLPILLLHVALNDACPSNCKCIESENRALCCLKSRTKHPRFKCPWLNLTQSLNSWTQNNCKMSWNTLTIEINSDNWPPDNGQRWVPYNISCISGLKQLIIQGYSLDDEDNIGLFNAKELKEHIFLGEVPNNLVNFKMTRTKITGIQQGFMDRLGAKQLKYLEITYNNLLENLETGWLLDLPYLSTLNLKKNAITKIDFVRWGMPLKNDFLVEVNLSGNRITNLDSDTFERTKNVTIINLDDNGITNLHADTFNNLHNLTLLSLRNNRLSIATLEGSLRKSGSFGPRQLLLTSNPLMKKYSSAWWLSDGCPENLQKLEIQDSGITTTNYPPLNFSKCSSLSLISVGNNITCIPQNWLGISETTSVMPNHLQIFLPNTLKICAPFIMKTTTPSLESNAKAIFIHSSKPSSNYNNTSFTVLVVIISTILICIITIIVGLVLCSKKLKSDRFSRKRFEIHQKALQSANANNNLIDNSLIPMSSPKYLSVYPVNTVVGNYLPFDLDTGLVCSPIKVRKNPLLPPTRQGSPGEGVGGNNERDTESSGFGNDSGISPSERNDQIANSNIQCSTFSQSSLVVSPNYQHNQLAYYGFKNPTTYSPRKSTPLMYPSKFGQILCHSSTSLNARETNSLILDNEVVKSPIFIGKPVRPNLMAHEPLVMFPYVGINQEILWSRPNLVGSNLSSGAQSCNHELNVLFTGSPRQPYGNQESDSLYFDAMMMKPLSNQMTLKSDLDRPISVNGRIYTDSLMNRSCSNN